jgi:hypothetical protein
MLKVNKTMTWPAAADAVVEKHHPSDRSGCPGVIHCSSWVELGSE